MYGLENDKGRYHTLMGDREKVNGRGNTKGQIELVGAAGAVRS